MSKSSNIYNKAIKYRIYPTDEQKVLLAKTFGCCRLVWNIMLNDKNEYYKTNKSMLKNTPAQYKEKYPFLREVDSLALANVQINLQNTFTRFFNKLCNYPNFKSKHRSKKSYTTNLVGNNITVGDNYIKLPKLKKVKAKIHRTAPTDWKIKSATISLSGSNRYYASILYEYEETIVPTTITKDKVLGLDYSTPSLYVDSSGNSPIEKLKYYKLSAEKLAKEQRKLSKKVIGSKNWIKQKQKVNKIHCKIANQRNDSLHKISTAITKQYDVIVIEDISIKEQIKSRKYKNYRKSTLDNGWYNFTTMLDYKLKEKGKKLIKLDKYYPSSQVCNCCGNINTAINNDSIRKWICPSCGTSHNRDINAAINIKNEGLKILGIA